MKSTLHRILHAGSPKLIVSLYVVVITLWLSSNNAILNLAHVFKFTSLIKIISVAALFVVLSAYVLYLILTGIANAASAFQSFDTRRIFKSRVPQLLCVILLLLMISPLINYSIFRCYAPKIERNTQEQLHSIASIKAAELTRWMDSRIGYALFLGADQAFYHLVDHYLSKKDLNTQKAIDNQLDSMIFAYELAGASLIDRQGNVITERGTQDPQDKGRLANLVQGCTKAGSALRSDLYINANNRLLMDVITPINVSSHALNNALAYAVIHIDLNKSALPSILAWPTTSKSAKALLVFKDATNHILFESSLNLVGANIHVTPINLKYTLYASNEAMINGYDFNKKLAFGARAVISDDWSIVTQIDQSEVNAPLRTVLFWISSITLVGTTLISFALLFMWMHQVKNYNLEIANENNERDRLLKRFFEMPFIGMGVVDPHTHQWLEVNLGLCNLLGYTLEEIYSTTWLTLSDSKDQSKMLTSFQAILAGNTLPIEHEVRFFHRAGHPIITRVEISITRTSQQDKDVLLIAFKDITDLKNTESALRQSEERLSLAFKGSKDGWWDVDLVDQRGYQSPSWWLMLGYDAPQAEGDPKIWQALSHPDDVLPIREYMTKLLASDALTFQFECRLRHDDGHYVPILTRGFISRDSAGNAVRISGTDTDISERLKAEATLKLQEEFNRALLENQADAVIACDANLKIVLFNHVARDWLMPHDKNPNPMDLPINQWSKAYHLFDAEKDTYLTAEDHPLIKAYKGISITDQQIVIKAPDQPIRYVSCNASSFSDESGQQLGAVMMMRDVTALTEHEQSLRVSEALYREMFDANPNPMWVMDAETRAFLAINDATINHYGWTREEFATMSLDDITVSASEQPGKQLHYLHNISGVFFPEELRHFKKDGSQIDVEITSNPLIFKQRQARLVMINDVTDRKQAENEIRSANRLLLMLTNINQTIVRRLSDIQMFEEACTIAVRDGGFSMAWIGIIHPESQQLCVKAAAGDTNGYLQKIYINHHDPDERGPTATAIRSGHHAICHDVITDQNFDKYRQMAIHNGYRSLVALPLKVNNHVVGNFNLYTSELGVFNQREMDLLDELASDISFALAVIEVEVERSLAEKALRESETLFHTLAKSSPVGVFHTDKEGNFLYINQSWYEITGIALEDAMSDEWITYTHDEDRNAVILAWNNTVSKRIPFNQEFRIHRGDNKVVWVKGQAAVEQDAMGNFLGFVGTVTDITKLKISEESHRMSTVVFENTREGIMVTDADNTIVMINRACTDITQYQEHELIGQTPSMIASGRHDRMFFRDMWQVLKTTGYWQGELWNRRKNGDIYPELLSISAIKNQLGEITNYVGVFADISSIKSSEEKLEFLAHHDPLTKLPNRLMLLSRLNHAIEVARRENTQLALLMLDLDRFKNVNDSFGHLTGDELLQQVAQRLTSKVRSVDTVTRLGGDEFTILLGSIASPEDAARVAATIIKSLEAPWLLSNNVEVRIGTSIGISLYPGHGETALELLQHADAALYQAKAAGRGCARYFSEKLTQAARDRFHIESRLRLAIQNEELRVYYQPKVDMHTGEIVGAEALIRWEDPAAGILLPTNFISVAEETGLIRYMGEWVMRETCKQGKAWLDAGLPAIKLAINLSAHQLHHTNIVQILDDLISETGFPASLLELELTESILMNRETQVIETLNEIRSRGITLAIDDFGTGYSSLSYLKTFPLDILKIDKSFVTDLENDADDRAITATIIKIAHTLGLQVVAEGVETPAQLDFLKIHECDIYQGHIHSEALPAAEFNALVKKILA